MSDFDDDEVMAEAIGTLVRRAVVAAADVSTEVEDIVQGAADEHLPDAEARALFERILQYVSGASAPGLTARQQAVIEKRVGEMVAEAMARRAGSYASFARADGSSAVSQRGHLDLFGYAGLTVRPVIPVPVFNGQAVGLIEGYVNTTDLHLWPENSRLDIYLAEFRERNGRDPDETELLQMLQGTLRLTSASKRDEFDIPALARSIATKGVQVPPIIDWHGVPRDGNRRLAACMMVLASSEFTSDEKARAAKIRVWQAPEHTTDDQFNAIVAALNFEADHKMPWREYVKARHVTRMYDELYMNSTPPVSDERKLQLRRQVAKHFAIELRYVARYVRMVRWAEQFEEHHRESRGRDEAEVKHRTNDVFEYFYELDSGRGEDKLSTKLERDEGFKVLVFDLLYDRKIRRFDHVRELRKVIESEPALDQLRSAHAEPDPDQGKALVEGAIAEARRDDIAMKRVNLRDFAEQAVKRLDDAPPAVWRTLDTELLQSLRRALLAAAGAVEAELVTRGEAEPRVRA
jgi:hypothetical protein